MWQSTLIPVERPLGLYIFPLAKNESGERIAAQAKPLDQFTIYKATDAGLEALSDYSVSLIEDWKPTTFAEKRNSLKMLVSPRSNEAIQGAPIHNLAVKEFKGDRLLYRTQLVYEFALSFKAYGKRILLITDEALLNCPMQDGRTLEEKLKIKAEITFLFKYNPLRRRG